MTVSRRQVVSVLGLGLLAGCAPSARMGMVVEPETGLQFGSVIGRSFILDPSQFRDPRIKLRVRNTSGDPAYNLYGFRNELEGAYQSIGYDIADSDEFGLLLDVNVRYSSQISDNLSAEYALLGATAGTVGAYGATVGYILGTYDRDETFIVIADVTVGLLDKNRGKERNTVIFGQSGDKKTRRVREYRGFRDRASTQVAVFAGGHNITQADIARQVRERFVRILRDII